MVSVLVSLIISLASFFNIVPTSGDLVAREQALKPSVQRIALLQSFSLEGSKEFGFYPHLPFNEDTGTFEQVGGDVPSLKPLKPNDIQEPLGIRAASALAIDTGTKAILFALNDDEPRILASLTKLMTALVVLDQKPDWNALVEILPSDRVAGESVKLSIGEHVTVQDLFFASLVASANNATVALVRGSGLTEEQAVRLMNEKAKTLGLTKTAFVDLTGLSEGNVSSPREFAVLASHAFAQKDIFEATSTKQYKITAATGVGRTILTTNHLLRDDKVVAGKTGFIEEAGYNLVSLVRIGNRTLLTVVFGAASNEERFSETEKLLGWLERNYEGWE